MVLSVFSPYKQKIDILYILCFFVHYFKSYGEIDNILKPWRPFWIYSIFIDLKNAIPFFLITTMFQMGVNNILHEHT